MQIIPLIIGLGVFVLSIILLLMPLFIYARLGDIKKAIEAADQRRAFDERKILQAIDRLIATIQGQPQ